MATAKDIISSGMQAFLEMERLGQDTLDKAIFPELDEQDAAGILLESYTKGTVTARVAAAGDVSNSRAYDHGVTETITPPTHKEKIPLTQADREKLTAGVQATATITKNEQSIYSRMAKTLISGHAMARNKSSLGVVFDGLFAAVDKDDAKITYYDFGRDAANSLTYNTTLVGATFDLALTAMLEQIQSKGAQCANLAVIMGSAWQKYFLEDEAVNKKRQAGEHSQLILERLVPETFRGGTDGLNIISRYNTYGFAHPVLILDYCPREQYLQTAAGTPEPFVPADTMAVFPIGAGMRFNRGMRVFGPSGDPINVVGDMVIDMYSEDDPIIDWIRSSSRFFQLFPNIDHTAKTVGTFA